MALQMGDYSQFYTSDPVTIKDEYGFEAGQFGRTWLGQLAGYGAEAENEDWMRSEQSANNAFYRSMLTLNEQNAFNASEAQKSRDWQEQMSNTAYQRAVTDMKLAGINPVLAFQQGGASTPVGASASSGSGGGSQASYSSRDRSGIGTAASIAKIIAGAISGSASITAAGIAGASQVQAAGVERRSSSTSQNFNYNYRR